LDKFINLYCEERETGSKREEITRRKVWAEGRTKWVEGEKVPLLKSGFHKREGQRGYKKDRGQNRKLEFNRSSVEGGPPSRLGIPAHSSNPSEQSKEEEALNG